MSALGFLIAIVCTLGVLGVMIVARAFMGLDYENDLDDEEMRKRTHIEPLGSISAPEGKNDSNLMSSL